MPHECKRREIAKREAALSRLRYNRGQAVAHLRACCGRLGAAIDRLGPFKMKVSGPPDLFESLASAIVYQQLSGKAAGTIYGRFCALFADGRPAAPECLQLGYAPLRDVGLSNNKALAVLDLAEKSGDGTLPSLRTIARLDDAAVIERLCRVRGIGPWTAQMFLMFDLGRPDVMPATDLGVQKGVQAVYELRTLPTPEQVLRRTRHLAPFRSAASWYFWRAADTELMAKAG
jgi:3-methyladenine DNA glycosylase/8-oxoguanine DNA glycosylase